MLPIIPLPLIDHLFSKFVALPVASLDSDACELLHTLTRVALSHQELVSSSPTTIEAVAEATSAATHQQNALERRSYGLAIFWRVLQDGSGAADDLALEAMRHLYELFQHQICTSLRYAIAADELLHSSLLIVVCVCLWIDCRMSSCVSPILLLIRLHCDRSSCCVRFSVRSMLAPSPHKHTSTHECTCD